eukprot:14415596-Ditylum_brightwellii.AAC.1
MGFILGELSRTIGSQSIRDYVASKYGEVATCEDPSRLGYHYQMVITHTRIENKPYLSIYCTAYRIKHMQAQENDDLFTAEEQVGE